MIETTVEGRPEDIRRMASFLRDTLGAETGDLADTAAAERRQLGDAWEGEAGSAFRQAASRLIASAEGLSSALCTMARAFDTLAAELEAVQAGMEQVRERARHGGLEVVGDQIRPPFTYYEGPLVLPPPPAPDAPPLEGLPQVFEECRASSERCHRQWWRAMTACEEVVRENRASVLQFVAALIVSQYSGLLQGTIAPILHAESARFREEAGRHRSRLTEYVDLMRSQRIPVGPESYDVIDELNLRGRKALEDAVVAAQRARTVERLGGVLRPLNPAASAFGLADDLANGESLEQAAVSQGGAWAAGGLVTAVASWTLAGTTLAPGPGTLAGFTAAVVVLGVGTAAGMLTDHKIDQAYESRARKPDRGPRLTGDEIRIAQLLSTR